MVVHHPLPYTDAHDAAGPASRPENMHDLLVRGADGVMAVRT
jgi:hypothetical protein